jgi:manganese/zinc/iron transport system permease protein
MNVAWTSLDTGIVVIGVLGSVSCALLGNFLVLRRMSMMGDAISHAVLPGLALAFLLSGSRASPIMFAGAAGAGVLTALFTQWIHQRGKVEESAAMGVVFTMLFAVGLIILVRAADKVDLDPGCVLYGAIELAPLDTHRLGGLAVPRAALILLPVLGVNILFVTLCYKELKISSFDPDLSTTLGFPAQLMHYLLMTLVAITAVASFESVGSILVIAMLIVPGATAHLWTDRLLPMILVSTLLAAVSAGLGHLAAITVPAWLGYSDTSTAGMMAVTGGLLFALTMLLAPRHGLISRRWHRFSLRLNILREDMLGLLYRLEEMGVGHREAFASPRLLREAMGVGGLLSGWAIGGLVRAGKVRRGPDAYRLTDRGREQARQLIRSHRLWESYLHRHFVLPVDHLHAPAEQLEHITDNDMQERLLERLEQGDQDPHGRRIPPRK